MNTQGLKQKSVNKLTPQQLMVANLLQVPISDLAQAIQQEIEKNPMLEEADHTTEEEMDDLPYDEQTSQENALDDYDEESFYNGGNQLDEDKNTPQASAGASLAEILRDQIALLDISERERTIGLEIIGSIDENGYLRRDLDLIVNDLGFRQNINTNLQELEEVLAIVQSLDPAGVGARNLQECLSLQLHREENPDNETRLATRIIDSMFEDFSQKRYDKIMGRLDIDADGLEQLIEIITHLDPKPGSDQVSTNDKEQYIIPDVIVTRSGDEVSYTINTRMIPKVQLSKHYSTMLKELNDQQKLSAGDKDTIQFLKEKMESAQNFIDAIQQRQHTLRSTMDAIMKRQSHYFLTGDKSTLKPLMQKEIAEATGLDDSTISRVVNQKYVQTEFGTFLLKEVFSQSFTTADGDQLASEAIKVHLEKAIENEDKSNPMTDEKLTKLLNGMGFPLARRTVAKYREQLGIPVGRLRKDINR